jgi:hypothetical protein
MRTRDNSRAECFLQDWKKLKEYAVHELAEAEQNKRSNTEVMDFTPPVGYASNTYSGEGDTNAGCMSSAIGVVEVCSGCFARDMGVRHAIEGIVTREAACPTDRCDFHWNWDGGGSNAGQESAEEDHLLDFEDTCIWFEDTDKRRKDMRSPGLTDASGSASSFNRGASVYVPGKLSSDLGKVQDHFATMHVNSSMAVVLLLTPIGMTAQDDWQDVSATGKGVIPTLLAQPAVNHRVPTVSHVSKIMKSFTETTDRNEKDLRIMSDGLVRMMPMRRTVGKETVPGSANGAAQINKALNGLPVEAQDLDGVLGPGDERGTHETMTLDGVEEEIVLLRDKLWRVKDPMDYVSTCDGNEFEETCQGEDNEAPEEKTSTDKGKGEDDIVRIERVLNALQLLLSDFMAPFGPTTKLDSWKRLYVHLALESGMFARGTDDDTTDTLYKRFNLHKAPTNFPCLFARCRILTQCQTSLRLACLEGLHRLVASVNHLMGVIMRDTCFGVEEDKFVMRRPEGDESGNIWSGTLVTVENELKSVTQNQGVSLVMLQMSQKVVLTGSTQREMLDICQSMSNSYQVSVNSAKPRDLKDALRDVIVLDIRLDRKSGQQAIGGL